MLGSRKHVNLPEVKSDQFLFSEIKSRVDLDPGIGRSSKRGQGLASVHSQCQRSGAVQARISSRKH